MEDEMSAKKFPTWGYRRGEAKIFDLGEGERLPQGWYDDPKKAASRAGSEPPWEAPPKETPPPVSESAQDWPLADKIAERVEKVNRAPETTPKTEKPKK